MNLWKLVRIIKPAQLGSLMILGLRFPLFIRPTLKASRRTVALADLHYGKQHHRNTPANAFRHALWNWFIARECFYWSKNEQKVLSWTHRITDLHEELLPNSPLAKEMDLHNNKVGRYLFKSRKALPLDQFVVFLKEKTGNSVLVRNIEELKTLSVEQLAHIVENDTDER